MRGCDTLAGMAGVSRECSPYVAPKPLEEDLESPLQSSDTVLDLRLLAAASGSRQASLTQSESDAGPLTSSSCSSPRQSATEAAEPATLDLSKSEGWHEASELLRESLAAYLSSGGTAAKTVLKVRECLLDEGSHVLQLRTDSSTKPVPLSEVLSCRAPSSLAAASLKDDDMRSMADLLGPDAVAGQSWATPPLPVGPAPMTAASKFASQALGALQRVLPEELLPTASSNWLAHGPLASSAVQLRLQGASGLVPLPQPAAELRTVSIMLPYPGLGKTAAGQRAQRLLLATEEQEAAGSGGWRLNVADGDSSAVMVSPTAPSDQKPGQLATQQEHARCLLADGGIWLSWRVASGVGWPAHALAHSRRCSAALQAAAIAARNPWHSEETVAAPQLHVLRLLFFAACSIPQVHEDVLEGLRRELLPLCRRELAVQAAQSLPQMNARPGLLEDASPGSMRCCCCSGEFVFSYVRLIERREERAGDLCWDCWGRRQDIGLCDAGPPRNARNCTMIPPRDVQRLAALLERGAPSKRAAPNA